MSVTEALSHIEGNDSGKSMDQMFDDLGQEIIAHSYNIIKRKKEHNVGMTKEEKEWMEEAQYQFGIIEKVFAKLKKNGRISAGSNQKFDEQLASKIKKEVAKTKSSIGQIVQMIPMNQDEAKNENK